MAIMTTRPDPSSPAIPSSPLKSFHNGTLPPRNDSKQSRGNKVQVLRSLSDVFESGLGAYGNDEEDMPNPNGKLPSDFDELPIELVTLADGFLDSLSAKIYNVPPSIDRLSELFQNFYENAENHINTHISALSSNQQRENSPAPSFSRTSRMKSKTSSLASRDASRSGRKDSDQQMLTSEEIAERKRNRKALELQRVALEEAMERRVCEGIYARIWRHRSTQDEAQDEKLRSKTAALSVVGIGLAELGIDLGKDVSANPEAKEARELQVRDSLEVARNELIAMNYKKYPLGKLQHLKAAHKAIVDTLAHFHPSSSADEIMPMMIFTLITSPPQGINVMSNLYFIQRFRSASKVDGEAAYCLTNLEAAITFLETVDLATLRADEMPSGPARSTDRSHHPPPESYNPMAVNMAESPGLYAPMSMSPTSATPSSPEGVPSTLRVASQSGNRRLSDLFQPAQALGNAGGAVLKSADHGFATIGNNLNDSYKFFLGKFKERQNSTSSHHGTHTDAPKTLDDARKLVGTPPLEEDGSGSGASSFIDHPESQETPPAKPADRVLAMIGGRRKSVDRDGSADSTGSNGGGGGSSSRTVSATGGDAGKERAPVPPTPTSSSSPLESMRNFGKNLDLNPMSRIAGIGGFRGFGRSTPTQSPSQSQTNTPTQPNAPTQSQTGTSSGPGDGGTTEPPTAFPDLGPASLSSPPPPPPPAKETVKIAPPIKRFMELQNPGDLRISEVMDLLRDYRRLAAALKDRGIV